MLFLLTIFSVYEASKGELVATIGESFFFKMALNNMYAVECAKGVDSLAVLASAIVVDTVHDGM